MFDALLWPISAVTPWIVWPNFAGQLQNMYETFIQPAIPWFCAVVIAFMLFRKLSNNPDQADIVAAVLSTIIISIIGLIIHQLPTIIASVINAGGP